MKLQFLTAVAVAAAMTAPALHAQSTTPTPTPTPTPQHERGARGMKGHPGMWMGRDLNLTDAQKAQVKAIHEKYEPQLKSAREALRPQMEAARAARQKGDTAAMRANREKMRSAMAPSMQIRQRELAEIRAILTPEQQQKFDSTQARRSERMRGGHHKPGTL